MSSSDNPSEKYSWSFFSLRSAKGSTATDLPTALAAGPAAADEAVAAALAGSALARACRAGSKRSPNANAKAMSMPAKDSTTFGHCERASRLPVDSGCRMTVVAGGGD